MLCFVNQRREARIGDGVDPFESLCRRSGLMIGSTTCLDVVRPRTAPVVDILQSRDACIDSPKLLAIVLGQIVALEKIGRGARSVVC